MVHIIEVLQAIVDRYVEAYESDFDYDKDMLQNAKPNERYVWWCRKCGTHCYAFKDVVNPANSAYHTLRYYAEQERTDIPYVYIITISDPVDCVGEVRRLPFKDFADDIFESFPEKIDEDKQQFVNVYLKPMLMAADPSIADVIYGEDKGTQYVLIHYINAYTGSHHHQSINVTGDGFMALVYDVARRCF